MSDGTAVVGVVAIGRNEGPRMVRCIESALRQTADPAAVVYVDSGSTDGSAEAARALGATVVDLDTSAGFTAARARNAGLAELKRRHPDVDLVQFVDADCEIVDGWVAAAQARLESDHRLAGVAGRRRERFPDATPYNKLCDLEWNTPVGPCDAVGGDALFRVAALDQVGGYDPSLIAGEEPEMCVRLREKGWTLFRLDAEMTLHDANMTRLGQWWRRAVRCGHAQAEVSALHATSPKRIWAKQTRSTLVWTLFPPAAAVALCALLAVTAGWPWWLLGLAPLGLYALLLAKVSLGRLRRGDSFATAVLYAANVTFAKFPQFGGALRYFRNRASGRRSTLIEYKGAGAAA